MYVSQLELSRNVDGFITFWFHQTCEYAGQLMNAFIQYNSSLTSLC